ncbi:MAG: hypothetical protein U0414_25225 [Polyangiaceae bacterium]
MAWTKIVVFAPSTTWSIVRLIDFVASTGSNGSVMFTGSPVSEVTVGAFADAMTLWPSSNTRTSMRMLQSTWRTVVGTEAATRGVKCPGEAEAPSTYFAFGGTAVKSSVRSKGFVVQGGGGETLLHPLLP